MRYSFKNGTKGPMMCNLTWFSLIEDSLQEPERRVRPG